MAIVSGDPQELAALNKAYAGIAVTPGYDVAFAICGNYFRMTSPDGRIVVETVDGSEVMPQRGRWSRYLFDTPKTIKKMMCSDDKESTKRLQEASRVMLIGDVEQWESLQKELSPYADTLRRCVDTNKSTSSEEASPLEESIAQHKDARLRVRQNLASQGGPILGFQDRRLPKEETRMVNFGAPGSWTGNIGQVNYCAACIYLDQIAMYSRQTKPDQSTITLQWGAVGGIGMRQKAFGSADFLLQDGGQFLFTIQDASIVLRTLVRFTNWVEVVQASYHQMYAFMGGGSGEQVPVELAEKFNQSPSDKHQPTQEVFGGDDVNIDKLLCDMESEMTPMPAEKQRVVLEASERQPEEEDDAVGFSFAGGDRVKLVGYAHQTRLNDMTGSVLKVLTDGKLRVKMDHNSPHRILHPKHLKLEYVPPPPEEPLPCPPVDEHMPVRMDIPEHTPCAKATPLKDPLKKDADLMAQILAASNGTFFKSGSSDSEDDDDH